MNKVLTAVWAAVTTEKARKAETTIIVVVAAAVAKALGINI